MVRPSLLLHALTLALWLRARRLSKFCGVEVDRPVFLSRSGGSGAQPLCRDLEHLVIQGAEREGDLVLEPGVWRPEGVAGREPGTTTGRRWEDLLTQREDGRGRSFTVW